MDNNPSQEQIEGGSAIEAAPAPEAAAEVAAPEVAAQPPQEAALEGLNEPLPETLAQIADAEQMDLPSDEELAAKAAAELKEERAKKREEIIGDVGLFESAVGPNESKPLHAIVTDIDFDKDTVDLCVFGNSGPFVKQGIKISQGREIGTFRHR